MCLDWAVFAIAGLVVKRRQALHARVCVGRTEDALPKEWRRVSVHAVGRQCVEISLSLGSTMAPLSVHS
jgi:hypothetical protein